MQGNTMKSLLRNSAVALSLTVSAMTVMAVPTLSAQAAVPTEASLLKLIKVTKVVEMMDDMTSESRVTEQVMQGLLAAMPKDDLNKSQRQQFDNIVNKYSKEIASSFDMQSFNQQIMGFYIESAKQHFNQQEVDAQITFYSSAIGQSIINKQPAIMEDYLAKVTSQVMPTIMKTSIQKTQDIMPRMAADIKALTAK